MIIATIKAILNSVRTGAEGINENLEAYYQVSASATDVARRYRAKQFLEAAQETEGLQETMDLLETKRVTDRQNLLK